MLALSGTMWSSGQLGVMEIRWEMQSWQSQFYTKSIGIVSPVISLGRRYFGVNIYILSNWQSPHIGPLSYGMRAIIVEMFHIISSSGVLPQDTKSKDTKPKAIPHSWWVLQTLLSPTKDLRDNGVDVFIFYPFNFPVWLLQKLEGSWRMTVDYNNLYNHQKIWQFVSTALDMVSSLEQVNGCPRPWYAITLHPKKHCF